MADLPDVGRSSGRSRVNSPKMYCRPPRPRLRLRATRRLEEAYAHALKASGSHVLKQVVLRLGEVMDWEVEWPPASSKGGKVDQCGYDADCATSAGTCSDDRQLIGNPQRSVHMHAQIQSNTGAELTMTGRQRRVLMPDVPNGMAIRAVAAGESARKTRVKG